jgi:hypothetical protein
MTDRPWTKTQHREAARQALMFAVRERDATYGVQDYAANLFREAQVHAMLALSAPDDDTD